MVDHRGTRSMPDWFTEHPLTKKIVTEREENILNARTEAAERLARSKEEAERILPELKANEDEARKSLLRHDEERKKFEGFVVHAATTRAKERNRLEAEKASAESILLSTYDERIDSAVSLFRELFEKLRNIRPDFDRTGARTNEFTMKKTISYRSNLAALEAALKYCNRSILELEDMRLAPVVDLERIEAIKKSIPDVHEMVEETSEYPLPPPPPGAVERIRSAEQAGTNDYLLRKLHEKADKLLRRR